MHKRVIHILLVEDNLADSTFLTQGFSRSQEPEWHLSHAETLEEAIELYQRHPEPTQAHRSFDLVLLDLGLPDSRGIETLKQFRQVFPNASVVVLTGLDDEELAMQAVAEGAQDYLVKDQITVPRLIQIAHFAIERQQLLIQLKHSEECARQAFERERELNELKTNFIGMVSHEFRTPMSIIRTATDLLERKLKDSVDDKCKKWFTQIQSANDQLAYLINDVLTLSQVNSTDLISQPVYFDLEDFCFNLVDIMRQSMSDRHTITLKTQGELNDIFTDINLFRYICTNLLSNAIKYSPQGGDIQFQVIAQDAALFLSIRDPGIGIPPKERDRLFDSFYRGSNVGQVSGTGLGLAIVKRCVDVLQGHIEVESTVNIGTTLTVKLPLLRYSRHPHPPI
jgi:signal transduction histidine kinase